MYKISKEERQMLLKYLQNRPYAEVFQLIALIVGLKPMENIIFLAKPSKFTT